MYEIKQCMIITNMKNAKITATNRRSSTPTPQKNFGFGSGRLNAEWGITQLLPPSHIQKYVTFIPT